MIEKVLWGAQVFAAVVFTLTGMIKLVVPREQLLKRMHWAASWPPWRIKLFALAELAGAAGLVVPSALGHAAVLVPVAAVCLALLMLGGIQTHRRLREPILPPLLAFVLCVAIAAGTLA